MARTAKKKLSDDPAQILLFADLLPDGNGGLKVVPRKSIAQEVDGKEVERILNCSKSTVSDLCNHPKAQKILRWRWLTEKQGKRLFDLESVLQLREALRDPEIASSN